MQLHLRTMLVKRIKIMILPLFGGLHELFYQTLVGLSIVGKGL